MKEAIERAMDPLLRYQVSTIGKYFNIIALSQYGSWKRHYGKQQMVSR